MSITPYSQKDQDFSNLAHLQSRTAIYSEIFNVKNSLSFEELPIEQAMTLDADMGIDRHVRVHVQGLRAPFSVLVQERFRRPGFARHQDVTITEWNHNSNLPGELFDILPMLESRGFPPSRAKSSCFIGGCPTSFHPNRSYASSTGIECR